MEKKSIIDPNKKYPLPHEFMKNVCIEFLKVMFAQRPTGDLKYNKDIEKSELFIGDKKAYNLNDVEKRPAITTVRGAMLWTNQGGLDNFRGGLVKKNNEVGNAHRVYSDLVRGSVSIECVSSQGLEADRMAGLVWTLFKYYRPQLRSVGFHKIESLSMGEEMDLKSDSKPVASMTPVNVVAMVEHKWIIEPTNTKRLENIIQSIL